MGIEVAHERGSEWVRGAIIGAGASGTVSLAMIRSNGHLFAVKSAAGFSLALDNEYHILRRLDSPYIVRCLGRSCSVENGAEVKNLFMEYMPGGSVADLMTKFGERLDESVIRAYTRGILRGIHYLHRQGIVHCDIKGKNVLVGANGVKLADFGSAKRIDNEEKRQEPLQLRGTPQWMAPEVVNQVEQGPASDIWSLACTVLEMATGRPPWSHVSSPLAAMYRIGCTEELPELPASLSFQIRDFLEKCFRRDPKKRWTSAELLNHPFLNQDCFGMKAEEVIRGPGSPTSHLDFKNQIWDSYSSQTTPILSLSIPSPAGESNAEVNGAVEQCPRSSPRDRVMALAVACKFEDVADRPNSIISPHGQWIVVRSSRGKSPTSDESLSKSDISNDSSIQELPFTKGKFSARLDVAISEELQHRCTVDEGSEAALSVAQAEHQSFCSTSVDTLHHDLFSMTAASNLINEAWDKYGNSSQRIVCGDPGLHNISIVGETFYIFDDNLTSGTQTEGGCCPCYNLYTTQFCHIDMIKGPLQRSYTFFFNCKWLPAIHIGIKEAGRPRNGPQDLWEPKFCFFPQVPLYHGFYVKSNYKETNEIESRETYKPHLVFTDLVKQSKLLKTLVWCLG